MYAYKFVLQASQGIIFVAHSLGGLVVKKALIISEMSAEDHLKEIEKHVIGVAFLGTPHRGSDMASFTLAMANIVKMSGRSVNTEILESLQKESPVLNSLENTFAHWIRRNHKRVNVTCFCEELEVRGIGMVVTRESAKIADRPQMSIHANHMVGVQFHYFQDLLIFSRTWLVSLV